MLPPKINLLEHRQDTINLVKSACGVLRSATREHTKAERDYKKANRNVTLAFRKKCGVIQNRYYRSLAYFEYTNAYNEFCDAKIRLAVTNNELVTANLRVNITKKLIRIVFQNL